MATPLPTATTAAGSNTTAKTNGNLKLNLIGLELKDYDGSPSTLCVGCGHNSISNQIVRVAYEMALRPHEVIKLSGIGCSSKSPAYFLNRSHGFNSLHGRMPSIATGACLANHTLRAIGVSGDGDTGSIGIGQFKHLVRRNVPMVYIIENNGVYGLTKGQFSPTADVGQVLKYAGTNEFRPVDLCMEALILGCGFVARSFAGDAKQVRELLKAALSYHGTAVIDIISPCVTFNDHDDSTKSYAYGRTHEEPLHEVTYIPAYQEITVDYEPGTAVDVEMHDGSHVRLKKLDSNYDATDWMQAVQVLREAEATQQIITGLIHINPNQPTLPDLMHIADQEPLAFMANEKLRPSRDHLAALMREMA